MRQLILSTCAILILLTGCTSKKVEFTPTPLLPSITPSVQPTNTNTPIPTYLPITPVWQGTPLPEHGDVITIENIDRLTLLSRWGQGNPGDIAYTPDGKYFVVGAITGLYIYDANDFSFIHYIDTQVAVINLAISPDSLTIATVVTDEVILYQISDWQLLSTIQVDANSVDFSPDGQMLALGINSGQNYLQLRDVETGEVIETLKNEQVEWASPQAVKISPRGDIIASGGYSITTWSLDGSVLDQVGPFSSGGHTASVSFSPDGEFLADASDYYLHIWRVVENGRLKSFGGIDLSQFDYASIFNVAISPNGKMVAATLSAGIGVWDLSTGDRIFYVAADTGYTFYNSLAWSMDSRTIAVASSEMGVELWSVNTGESLASLNNHSGSFSSLVWSPDGQKLGVGAEEGIPYIFNAQNGDFTKHFGSGYELNSLAFSPDSQTLAVGYRDRSVQIWNLDGALLHTLGGFGYGSSDATFSPDGSFFAATLPESRGTPPEVRFWNTSDWSVEKIFSVENRDYFRITGFVLAPDQYTGAISYVDMDGFYDKDLIEIISIADGTSITTLEPWIPGHRAYIQAMSYSPNSTLLAALVSVSGDPNPRIVVWQNSDWKLLYRQEIIAGPRIGRSYNQQDALAWSPDSMLIAVGVKDGSIQIFNAVNREKLITLNGHTMWATGVSFSPDGRILVSVSLDGTVMLWGLR